MATDKPTAPAPQATTAFPDPQQAPPDAKPITTGRPPPIVPDAPTIDELNVDGTLKRNPVLAAGNPKIKPGGAPRSLPVPPPRSS